MANIVEVEDPRETVWQLILPRQVKEGAGWTKAAHSGVSEPRLGHRRCTVVCGLCTSTVRLHARFNLALASRVLPREYSSLLLAAQ